ncbi:hypothetical protein DAPPUDRAFT_259138 [Daphnia pulex]|uniref:Uncharacterized protein n=1 Tax=Daphnia pulex TaxID=6669 RepID=E9HGM0_DAPPU|nr:hypothetical protein DAPPUDRAFT_259138 [Daphnia pulex]|eukprot:EFX69108.1 hypothetical protein DAPPUDRAFT_259138 [Daphnia pulex]
MSILIVEDIHLLLIQDQIDHLLAKIQILLLQKNPEEKIPVQGPGHDHMGVLWFWMIPFLFPFQ